MPRASIDYAQYRVKAFLDANIILEGKPLAELPWQEVDVEGPILALVTPTAIKEIDSKKRDGRIGKIAREFNRTISPAAIGGTPVVIREAQPRVELALAMVSPIAWEQFDTLDPEDGDSRIVAEVLHAKAIDRNDKLIVSHDIKPLAFAALHELRTLHVSDSWLRQPEPSPADKENQRLKQRLAEYQATEPAFEIFIEIKAEGPVPVFCIEDLTDDEQREIHRKILQLNPRKNQSRGGDALFRGFEPFDHSYDERYEAYEKRLSTFMARYAQELEALFNQVEFSVTVVNVGRMQAENLLIEASISNGWLHDRFAAVSPRGPRPPKLRSMAFPRIPSLQTVMPPLVGRHEFDFNEEPDCGSTFAVTCQDFRHGQEWCFDGVVGLDARAGGSATIAASVTASNFRGIAKAQVSVEKAVRSVHISEVIDLDTMRVTTPLPMSHLIDSKKYDAIDWRHANDDDD